MSKEKTVDWFFLPDLVVITITPFPPLTPYKAVVEASFKTETLSISEGLIASISQREEFIPSITTKGSVPENEVIPLISTEGLPPGLGLEITFNPVWPCKASSTLRGFNLATSSPETVETDPDILDAFWVLYPTRIISSNAFAGKSLTSKVVELATRIDWEEYPT